MLLIKFKFSMPSSHRSTILCTAIRHGSNSEFLFALDQYGKTNNQNLKKDISTGLACTKEIWLINKYLYQELENGNINEVLNTLRHLANKPNGVDLAWNFIKDNWNFIYERYFKRDMRN